MRRIVLFMLAAQGLMAQVAPEVRTAIIRALPPLEKSASVFVEKRACFSCHHNALTIPMLHLARERGLEIDPSALAAVEDRTFRSLRGSTALDDAIQAATLDDPTPNDSTLLMAAHDAGLPPDLTTAVYARRIALWQRDGHWVTSDFRPPHSSSLFTATATAIRAIDWYMPEELHTEKDAVFLRARRWLAATRAASTEDASFRLMGLVWAGASPEVIEAARRDLLTFQKAGSGWPELPGYEPDAYSTGEALFALRESGMRATNRMWQMGSFFLVSTQQMDGTWRVHTRMVSPAEVSPKYFSTGFPYEKDEYLSYAGSCWAVMALLSALPIGIETAPPVATASSWMRIALFGSAADLSSLLNSGLDPNRATDKGTTLLMMAATDPAKVRLLLARGADPKKRTHSGVDALTVASAYRATAASLRLLLDAGASANPPEGVRVRRRPLTFAAMTGDLENVRLLVSRGAESPDALSEAVTFGYPDVVRALIASGASAKETEASGINLVHWAVITNHPQVIPLLVAAGVPINAKDQAGYTPLMYAATIDFGGSGSVRTLLKAGADPKIRNRDGRTAFEQARYFRHPALEAALSPAH